MSYSKIVQHETHGEIVLMLEQKHGQQIQLPNGEAAHSRILSMFVLDQADGEVYEIPIRTNFASNDLSAVPDKVLDAAIDAAFEVEGENELSQLESIDVH